MKIFCPRCDGEIFQDTINISENLFLCKRCGEHFKITYAMYREKIENLVNNPPKGTWIRKDYRNLYIGFSPRSPRVLFLAIFTLLFGGVSFFGLVQILTYRDVLSTVIFLPFAVFTVFLIYKTLSVLFGKIELVFGDRVFLFSGLGPLGNKKYIDWENVKGIWESKTENRQDETSTRSIVIQGGQTVRIPVDFVDDEKVEFFVTALTYFRHKNISGII